MQPIPLQEEFDKLQRLQFLQSNDTINDIQFDFHKTTTWAEVFWRRRYTHERREDPELPFVFQLNSSSILEIGAGYGRILRKLIEGKHWLNDSMKFQGIETCTHFKPYFHRYQSTYPSLNNCDIIFEDFLTTSAFKETFFDIILLPMNTFPSFSFNELHNLFTKVQNHLGPDGMFLFSTFKIPGKLPVAIDRGKGHDGELLLELGRGIIAAEYYEFPATEMEYGAQSVTYMCYNTFTRDYTLASREIYRYTLHFVSPAILQEVIETVGFSIKILDDSSHSRVYGLITS
ncbi:MAG: hypothetical protein JSW11_13545 [Candidatus Heimdallarchaeota archaeon]|nr:MAG: hypothetical protein JSW11_13545 [Candidatus Heimdallarchaeota archaeon]